MLDIYIPHMYYNMYVSHHSAQWSMSHLSLNQKRGLERNQAAKSIGDPKNGNKVIHILQIFQSLRLSS